MLLNQTEVPSKGPLDDYTTGLYASWGITALRGGYPWALDCNNGTTDQFVPFRGTSINSGHATSLGANVTAQLINHDRSNSGNYAARTLTTGRPGVVSSSSYLGHVEFDGTSDWLATPSNVGGVSGVTIFLRGKLRSTSATQIIFELTTNYNGADGFIFYYDNAISRLVLGTNQATGSRYAISEFSASATTEAVFCIRYDRTQTAGADQCVLFVNGTKQTRTGSTGETGTRPSGNFATSNLHVGARGSGSGANFSTLNLKSMAVYHTALSDSDCSTISGLL